MKKIVLITLVIALAIAGWLYFVKGYVGMRRRHAVPEALMYKAEVPGIRNVRFLADLMRLKSVSLHKMIEESGLVKAKFMNPEINVLALSGGGANGAYGAGVLCGWTEAGTRPQFDIVTGVSTGALIAPAAFLGPEYDGIIRDIYTNVSDADIMKYNVVEFLFGGRPSFVDTSPLRVVLENKVPHEVIEAIAREHKKGRRLYIATTNLDAKRLVIWDMGKIACAGTPESEKLFRQVMLASASFPVAFPPVMIKVEAEGHYYDEMHVDGSIATQIIGSMLIVVYDEVEQKKTNVYVIRNWKMADIPREVPYKVWDIAGVAFSTLITWQGYGDIQRFAVLARRTNMNLYFTCIPYEFDEPRSSEFDLPYMRKLFYSGRRRALSDNPWVTDIEKRFDEALKNK